MKKKKGRILIRIQASCNKPGKYVAWVHAHPDEAVPRVNDWLWIRGRGRIWYGSTEGRAAGKAFAALVDQGLGSYAVEIRLH